MVAHAYSPSTQEPAWTTSLDPVSKKKRKKERKRKVDF
jgi:hypothetical protein